MVKKTRSLIRRSYWFNHFLLGYLLDLFFSGMKIALHVLGIRKLCCSGTVFFVTEARSKTEVALLAQFITFSPGSMVVDFLDNGQVLEIHSMFAHDEEAVVRNLREVVEQPLLRSLR